MGNLHLRPGGHYSSVFARDILEEVPDFFEFNQNFFKMRSLTNSQKHQKWVNPYFIVFVLTNFPFFTHGHFALNTHDCSKTSLQNYSPATFSVRNFELDRFLLQVGRLTPTSRDQPFKLCMSSISISENVAALVNVLNLGKGVCWVEKNGGSLLPSEARQSEPIFLIIYLWNFDSLGVNN